jgi:hypothetical protein
MEKNFLGEFLGISLLFLIFLIFTAMLFAAEEAKSSQIKKEAFERGYMEKIINDKDEVEYRWVDKNKN